MGDFNRSAPTLLGSEWRPQSSRTIVLSSKTRAVAQRIRPSNVTPADIDLYLSQIIGTPGIGIELVDTLSPTLDTASIRYPGTNTGATKSDWVDEASGTSDYSDLAKQTAGTAYLQPNTSAQAQLLFRGASAISAGKRIVSITQNVLVGWPGVADGGVKSFFYTSSGGTAYAPLTGVFNISGTDYSTGLSTTSPVANPSVFSGSTMFLNPSTGIPWTLTQANALCNGTDEWGVTKAKSIYTLEHRMHGMWLEVATCAENRLACYYSATAQTKGWQRYVLVHPDTGGTIAALSSNTYYYLVVMLLNPDGGASLTIPALEDTNLILAASASASTGDFRQVYDCTISSGVVTGSTALPGVMIPAMLENPAATFNAESQPYVGLSAVAVSTGPSQEVTATSGTTYAGVRLNVGWESTNTADGTLPPDAPLLIELRHDSGALTGGGTLDATATLAPDALKTGALQDVTVAFDASVAVSSTQYVVFFRSSSSTGRGWCVGRLDCGSNLVSTISAANVQAQTIGGTTDSYADTAGTEDDRYDIPVALVTAVAALSSLTATVQAAA